MEFVGFQWDEGNRAKYQKHGVSIETIEALFATPIAILPDAAHSGKERRFCAIGKVNKKELTTYEKENPDLDH